MFRCASFSRFQVASGGHFSPRLASYFFRIQCKCAFIIKWGTDRTLVSCVRMGLNKLQRDTNSVYLSIQGSACMTVPDTGQLSDRRLLWSCCQTLIWANIEEHSAIASMIAAPTHPCELAGTSTPLDNKGTYLEMFSKFAFSPIVHKNDQWSMINYCGAQDFLKVCIWELKVKSLNRQCKLIA